LEELLQLSCDAEAIHLGAGELQRAPQGLAMGYSPGVALEIDYAAFQYNEIWSSNHVP